jgi:hypothetical protein
MEKYLYLIKKEWVSTWIDGGEIPISLASTYLSDARDGTQTPDENRIHESNVDLESLEPMIKLGKGASIGSFTMTNSTFNGQRIPDILDAKYILEDGLILSFCNKKSKNIAQRLGKEACVKILDIAALKEIIDEQLGIEGTMGPCEYTTDHQRNHFLKSSADSWQDEYRIFWPLGENRIVNIHSGLAVSIKLKNLTSKGTGRSKATPVL